ncbi:hypothetical protein U0070_005038 [Myodes glareolus]|uniref:Uncharacterized protein n=1 Tax=Myodes glareolus TaxID=447135 RepID=A0AAW0IG75_MYOGA
MPFPQCQAGGGNFVVIGTWDARGPAWLLQGYHVAQIDVEVLNRRASFLQSEEAPASPSFPEAATDI